MHIKIYTCNICGLEKSINELDVWNMKNNIVYECIDRKKCNNNKMENQIKKNVDLIEKNKKVLLQNKFNINLNDLNQLQHRFRDNSVHYYDDEKNIYSWNIIKKEWYIADNNTMMKILNFIDD